MPAYATAGAALGCPFDFESQLERIARRLRSLFISISKGVQP